MAFKFVVLAALVAVANAGAIVAPFGYAAPAQLAYASAPVGYAQPIAKTVVAKTIDTEFDPHPQYSYAYDVQDGLTGDSKGQHETREGDVVHGSYNLLEADGTRRIVDYTADPVNGFNAVVRKEPAAVAVKAVAAAPVVKAVAHAPVAFAAPQYAQYAAPALYAAHAQYPPIVKTVSHAPIVAQPALQYAQYAHAPLAYARSVGNWCFDNWGGSVAGVLSVLRNWGRVNSWRRVNSWGRVNAWACRKSFHHRCCNGSRISQWGTYWSSITKRRSDGSGMGNSHEGESESHLPRPSIRTPPVQVARHNQKVLKFVDENDDGISGLWYFDGAPCGMCYGNGIMMFEADSCRWLLTCKQRRRQVRLRYPLLPPRKSTPPAPREGDIMYRNDVPIGKVASDGVIYDIHIKGEPQSVSPRDGDTLVLNGRPSSRDLFQFVVLTGLVAVANAGYLEAPAPLGYAPVGYAQPIAKAVVAKTVDTEFDHHPQYSYAYDVQDGLTGDSKGQHETRDGDLVQGSYNFLEADGTRRIVDYTADSVNGFNAVVRKEPAAVAVKAVAHAPIVAAPQYAQYAQYEHAPVAKSFIQPAAQYAQYSHDPVEYAPEPHYGYAAAPGYYH
ncbi:uncharacterized protein LOC117170475 [Belonocnema kinseyi]|uniref:uncharacterized protein LOC117170475 n=1 Tax=Belonocnema kinseyi TaxID=2817044 RepID=UPI00143DE4FB|nr:uncharacterized protein LOC117170475 [Belonocnema kinseyi]